jgi:prolipoprotein diacylglyceryltransferase
MFPGEQVAEQGEDSRVVGQLTARRGAPAAAGCARYTAHTVPTAVIEFTFDPILRVGDSAVRLETLALAGVILAVLLLGARIAGGTPAAGEDPGPFVHRPRLRRDDLLFIALGVLPGAVAGGRIGYALLHLDYYASAPFALLDPALGSLELSLAVLGGAGTGAMVARLLDGPVGRSFHVATLPLLVGLALGKAATALGGDGQGTQSDLPWATAYVGPGPWGSLAPGVPAHPAQLYEAVATVVVLVLMVAVLAAGGFGKRDGRSFLVALALWALGRALAAATWRDATLIGPFNAGQLIALAIAVGAVGLAVRFPRLAAAPSRPPSEPTWPDPETRPHF